MRRISSFSLCLGGCALASSLLSMPALSQPAHAHTHGVVTLDVAVDAKTLTLRLQAPLDSLVGFERAPRTAAERQRAEAAVARLKAGGTLLRVDPAARCTLADAQLESAALGLGPQQAQGPDKNSHRGHDHDDGHADLDATYTFDCERAADARFVELGLWQAFPAIRTVNAQVAAPQGQFRRTLGRKDARLSWGR